MGSKPRFFRAVLTLLICGSCFAIASAQPQIRPGRVLISELRLAGEGGVEDEYVEIYNNTNKDIFVQATDQSSGWAVVVSSETVNGQLFIIPNGTRIPARGHFLGANGNGYLANTTPNTTWEFDIPENDLTLGLALFSTTNTISQSPANRLDAFGMVNAGTLFKEGAGFGSAPAIRTLVRDMRTPAGFSKDTDNNAADFLLLSDWGRTGIVGAGELLGAPGPENLNSPVTGVHSLKASPLDPIAGSDSPPNRERRLNFEPNANLGLLLIRRTFTNHGSAPISRLRFRVIEITGPGADNTCGGALCADVRVLTSQDGEAGSPNIGVVPVRGLTLEQPPVQMSGGGFNSILSANSVTLQTPLLPGASINVEFKLGVMRIGAFRLLVNFEAEGALLPAKPGNSDLFARRRVGITISEGDYIPE